LFEYTGVIHVHSTYSDGSGSIPDIIRAAHATGLDFVLLSDHNTLRARTDGWEGWHGNLLLVVGEEATSREGHCLVVGTRERIGRRGSGESIIRHVAAQEGLSFLAHPHGVYRPFFRLRDHSWRDWRIQGFTGLEVWSYMFDWVRDFRFYRWSRHYHDPDAQILGPFPNTLAAWDSLCRQRRVVGIGGVDAHARRYPCLPFVVFPYADLFLTLRTHVLLPEPLTGRAPEDIAMLLEALGEGSCFLSYDLLADGTGVRFESEDGAVRMGQEAQLTRPISLRLQLPEKAEVTILADGRPVFCGVTDAHTFDVEHPGVYRAEARTQGKPWIFTNPIYLRGGAQPR